MAINEAGKAELARRVDYSCSLGRRKIAADGMDSVATNQYVTVGELGFLIVEGGDATGVADEDMFCWGGHG